MTKAERISLSYPPNPKRSSYYVNPLCPKCYSHVVTPVVNYSISHFKLHGIPMPMWACQNPLCLCKWPRAAAA